MKKPAAKTALIATTALLVGCSTSSASPAEDEPETPKGTCVEGTLRGAVVEDIVAENSYGEYCTVKVDPEGSAFDLTETNIEISDPTREYYNLTDEEIQQALTRSADFVVKAFYDNPNAGGYTEGEGIEWMQKNRGWYSPNALEQVVDDPDATLTNDETGAAFSSQAIFTLSEGTIPPLLYNGGSRLESLELKPIKIDVGSENEDDLSDLTSIYVRVQWEAVPTYRIDPDQYVSWRESATDLVSEDTDVSPEAVAEEGQDFSEPMFFRMELENDEEKMIRTSSPILDLRDNPTNHGVSFTLYTNLDEPAFN